ncbi:rhomboid-like protein [Streptomyces sp. I05A-00742]|uniref:rhomboid-like protein n=1 Tax=Streptomyces sp. I05A-00742 TaxID=2732853 RepID=UPI0020171FBB|nr:rhomboid-like protein [Streptomyces sp. I05A-00742]
MERDEPGAPGGGRPSVPARLRRYGRGTVRAGDLVRSWVRGSPGTHIWLLVIGVTSLVVAAASEGLETFLLHRTSSNIHQLAKHPLQSLLISGFWIETPSSFLLYAVLFELIHANVERWAGTLRWLFTVGVAHVAATLTSQEVLLVAIEHHAAPRAMRHVVDIGVSYGLAAGAGLLTYRIPRPWRWYWLAALVLLFATPLATGATFTDVGHAIAVAVGLACGPLVRGRPTWDAAAPGRAVRTLLGRGR